MTIILNVSDDSKFKSIVTNCVKLCGALIHRRQSDSKLHNYAMEYSTSKYVFCWFTDPIESA